MTDAHFIDFKDPAFSTRSDEIVAARHVSWYARTPFGIAVLRHREAGLLLRDRRLRQGSHAWPGHTGLTGSFADFWQQSVIATEGDRHRRLRRIAQAGLEASFIAALEPAFASIASDLFDAMHPATEINFMEQFSTPFAGQAICELLGLPRTDWRTVAQDATTLGLAMGVAAKTHEEKVNAATDRLMDLAAFLVRRARRETDTFVARLIAAEDSATADELLNLIVMVIFGGVDTTRAQLGFGMALFIDHPDQWRALKADSGLVPNAVEEMIRARPTTTWSTREALEEFEFNGTRIEAGETIHILVHATARDPLVCDDPGFDITATRKIHFGFGGGSHHCLGALVARTDMAAALREIRRRLRSFSFADTPSYLPDSGNTSPLRLPLRLEMEPC